jgi:hypothetical protein
MIERGDTIKDMQALVIEKDASIAYEQEERCKLSGAYDELERQFEKLKNSGVQGLHLLRQLDDKDKEIESLKAQLVNKNPTGMQDLITTIKAELGKGLEAGKMASAGVNIDTQTEDDGTVRKFIELAVKAMTVLDKVAKRDKTTVTQLLRSWWRS